MTVQYLILSYTAKAVLGEKFIDVEAHIRKLETFQINNLMMYSKFQEKKKPTSNPADDKKQLKNKTKMNETETKRTHKIKGSGL